MIHRPIRQILFEEWNNRTDQLTSVSRSGGISCLIVIAMNSNARIARSNDQRIANRFEVAMVQNCVTYSVIIRQR